MSTEREARAVGAGESIDINGKQYTLRPVVVQHLCDLEREALKAYKRQVLSTYLDNADLLGITAQGQIDKKFEQVSRWDLSDLPQKDAYDAQRIPITEKIKEWITKNYGEVPPTENAVRAILVNALDTGKLTPDEVESMSGGVRPIHGRVRYDQWWVTACTAGMLSFITSSVRRDHPEVTYETVASWPFPKVAEAVRIVEALTAAQMGNT